MTRNTLTLPIVLAVVLAQFGCGQNESSGGQDSTSALNDDGRKAFVGSESCKQCHDSQYRGWMGSHHQLAMQAADTRSVLGDFDDASYEYFGETTRFYSRDDKYYVRTADSSDEGREFRIAYTFGIEPLQQYLIEFPGGRLQTLAYSWDSRPGSEGGQRWFHVYPDEYIAPDDALHWTGAQQNWNYMCAECHSTNVSMGFDLANDTFNTTFSEISVGCESCHGPGALHVQRAQAGLLSQGHGLAVDLDDNRGATWVMNADTGIAARSETRIRPQQQPEACGRCHARRGVIAPAYEYGKPLTHTHLPALLDDGLYFADGQILDEVYVYGSFLQSRMYEAGVTCTDCHDAHSYELKTGDEPNDVCAQCHSPARFSVAEHASHLPEQAGCVDCHMVSRTYMVVDDRRDHGFRVPRPDLTETIGTPNACNACHDDADAAWAAAAINDWQGSDAWQRPHYATAIDAGRRRFANAELVEAANNNDFPGIARATAVSLLAQPFSSRDLETLDAELGNPDPLIRIAALRQAGALPADLRLRLSGAELLADPVRGVRIEAARAYAGTRDLLPIDAARAWQQAEQDFRSAYAAIANRPEAHLALAGFELSQNNVAAAIGHYETALRIEPRAATARVNLADALRTTGDEARGEALLREGLALDPGNAALRHALGLSLVRGGRPGEALVELRKAAELAPENPRFAYVLAIALNSLGEPQEALQVMRAAHSEFGRDFEIAMALATLLRDGGEAEAALEIARELAQRHPENRSVSALLQSLGAVP